MAASRLSWGRRAKLAAAVLGLGALSARVGASEPNAQRVNHFVGAAGESLAIQVPPFHGLEPRLGLSYSSEARNGFAGMGWNLTGFSVIERVNNAWGVPRFDSSDVFTLDGQTLLACPAGSSYPSCASGGTHYTHQESYLKVKKVSDTLWEVYGKDGTRTEFAPIHSVTYPFEASPTYSLRLGQSKVVDTHGNTVNYNWALNADGVNGATYPASVTYNGITIEFFREVRPDGPLTRGAIHDVARLGERLKSVVVRLSGGTKIRAYKVSYTTSAATGKSLLTSVQTYGKDAVVDGSGNTTSGTALPAQSFAYVADVAIASFTGDVQLSNAGPPAVTALENVVWIYQHNTTTVGSGNTLQSLSQPDQYKYASGSRALSSGSGYLDFTYTPGANRVLYFGQYGVYVWPSSEVSLLAGGVIVAGPYPVSAGQVVRLQVATTGVVLIVNGVPKATHVVPTTYPMNVVGYILGDGEQLSDVRLSGSLVNGYSASCGAEPRFFGDFNGDGRKDSVCRDANGTVSVSLATATGFLNPTIWAGWGDFIRGVGDFNNDGRDDIVFFDSWNGNAYVGLSDGIDFGAISYWGHIGGYDYFGYYYECRTNGARLGKVADYNSDGKLDISCYIPGEEPQNQFVGLSTGTSFSSSVFSTLGCQQPYGNMAAQGQADFNGDGRDDWSCTDTYSGDVLTFLSAGSFFFYDTIALTGFCSPNEYSFGDWNGDGATDAACANNLRAGLHTGRRFTVLEAPVPAPYCVSGQRLAADLDGDGAAEWICNNPGTPANDIEVRRWNGLAFGPAQTWRGGFCGGTLSAADFNGDGKMDLLCESTGGVIYAGTKDVKADLLTHSANGIGGTATLAYTTTTQHLTGSAAGLPAKYIVASITASDGHPTASQPTAAVTTFVYQTGTQNDAERKFFGFQTVTEALPKLFDEQVSPVVVRKFRIDAAAAGSLEEVARYDGQSKILNKTRHEYLTTETTGASARRTKLLSATWNYQYTGLSYDCASWPSCADGKRTKTEYAYDSYGNQVQAINHGDFDLTGDETTTTTNYTYNYPYIVGLPGKVSTYSGIGASGPLLAEARIIRDGNTAWNQLPTKGDATKTEAWLNVGNRYVSSTAAYDGYGNITSSTDPTNRTVSSTYDATYHVFPITATNAASENTSTTWDYLCAAPLTTTDPNGQVTTLTYDQLCRATGATAPLGAFETRSYLNLGNPATQKARVETPGPDGTNDWTEAYFDGWGRTYRTMKRGPSANQSIVTDVQFNARGGLDAQTAPYYATATAKITYFGYDGFDRSTVTTLPDGRTRSVSYPGLSAEGLFQTAQTNELTQSSTTKFDVFGRVTKEEKYTALHGNLVTTRNYDILGRMTSLVDPLSNPWSYTYDSLGRNLTKNDPDAGLWTYSYDDASRVVTQTDAKGQTTTLTYDSIGRISTKANPTETVTTTYSQARSGYFNTGRPTTVASSLGNGTLQFDYDALGRVVKQTRTLDGTNYTVQRNYDTAGYLRGMQYPDGDIIGRFGSTGTNLGYDQAGRLSSIPGILTSVTYNAMGAPLVQTNANGTTTTKTYDANRFWLKTIGTTTPSLTLQNLSYTLNDAGMATAVTSPFGTEGWTYAYDEMNRLISSTNTGAPANNQTWTYDSLGRIQTNSRIGNYTYGSSRPHAVTAAGSNTYTAYDANGNLQTGGGRTLSWNADNLITQVVMGGNTTTFNYGPDGDRIKKTAGAVVAKYPFGDDYEINGTTVTKYFNAGFGVIAKKVGTTKYWLHTDRLGSINATTTSAGVQVLRRSYRSYGELLGQTGTHTEKLGYIGQRTDSETGLTYLHARYYDPMLGVFLSPDPAGADRNTYRYARGNPANFSDPTGLDCTYSGPINCTDEVTVYAGGDTSGYDQIEGLGDGADDRRSKDQEQREREAEKGLCIQADGTMGQCSGDIPARAPTPAATPSPTPASTPAPNPASTPKPLNKADALARDALIKVNPVSQKTNSEFCFSVCKTGNAFNVTKFSTNRSESFCTPLGCPSGSTLYGVGHTHVGPYGEPGLSGYDAIYRPWDQYIVNYQGNPVRWDHQSNTYVNLCLTPGCAKP